MQPRLKPKLMAEEVYSTGDEERWCSDAQPYSPLLERFHLLERLRQTHSHGLLDVVGQIQRSTVFQGANGRDLSQMRGSATVACGASFLRAGISGGQSGVAKLSCW